MSTNAYVDLWTSVIEGAVLDVLTPQDQGADFDEAHEAYEWLTRDDYSEGGFRWACGLCDISEETIMRIRAKIC